jgi:MFS family permease
MAGNEHASHDRDATVSIPAAAATGTAGHGAGASMSRGTVRDAVGAQRARYGGMKWGAAFFGWLSANGLAVLLLALLSAAGVALGLSQGLDTADEAAEQVTTGIGLGGGIAVLVILFLAYLAGGYVAGRMSRFDGFRQGLAVWLIGLLVVLALAAAGAILGSEYNVLQQLNLPRIPVDEGTATTAGIITLAAVLLATLLGAILGGKLGERYHRKVDRAGFDVS